MDGEKIGIEEVWGQRGKGMEGGGGGRKSERGGWIGCVGGGTTGLCFCIRMDNLHFFFNLPKSIFRFLFVFFIGS